MPKPGFRLFGRNEDVDMAVTIFNQSSYRFTIPCLLIFSSSHLPVFSFSLLFVQLYLFHASH
ncbi:MAG: hypothetical protein ACLFM7_03345 [Bacteroidales bacterium]